MTTATTPAHTPGPWTVGDGHIWHIDEATGMGYRFKPIEFAGGCLAWVADDDGDAEAEPNARLIAAAPELLKELKEFVDRWTKYDRPPTGDDLAVYIRCARKAIAKAEGR